MQARKYTIIPVIPVINSTNSCESLLDLLKSENGTKHDISGILMIFAGLTLL